MTPFRQWGIGKHFEMFDHTQTRFGVKVTEKEAFFFDTCALEPVNHNKKVSVVRSIGGRLARTHDNDLIIVEEPMQGVYAGYTLNPIIKLHKAKHLHNIATCDIM